MAYEQQRQYKTEIKRRKRKWHQVLEKNLTWDNEQRMLNNTMDNGHNSSFVANVGKVYNIETAQGSLG